MQPSNPLDTLPPLALPADISWWPLAIGWWALSIFTILLLAAVFITLRKYWRAGIVKRLSLKELDIIYKQFLSPLKANEDITDKHYRYLHSSNQLLRKFCIQHYGNQKLATGIGKSWLAELDTVVKTPCLNSTEGEQLLKIYQPNAKIDNVDALNKALEKWLCQAKIKPNFSFKTSVLKKIKIKRQRLTQ